MQYAADCPPVPPEDWDHSVANYPAHGPSGAIIYFQDISADSVWSDVLLSYDDTGNLQGFLGRHPADKLPFQAKNAVQLHVRPDRQLLGVATGLWEEAVSRWQVVLAEQHFTADSAAAATAYSS